MRQQWPGCLGTTVLSAIAVMGGCADPPPRIENRAPTTESAAAASPAGDHEADGVTAPTSLAVEQQEWRRDTFDAAVMWGTRTDSVSSAWTVTIRNDGPDSYRAISYRIEYRDAAGAVVTTRTGRLPGDVAAGTSSVFVFTDGFVGAAVASASFQVAGARRGSPVASAP